MQVNWEAATTPALNPASTRSLDLFEHRHEVVLPADLRAHFQTLDGTDDREEQFIRFTSLAEFTSLLAQLVDQSSDSPYRQLLSTLPVPAPVFVLADYEFFLYAYAIRLAPTPMAQNEVYMLCGEQQLLSPSFTAFPTIQLPDDRARYFSDEQPAQLVVNLGRPRRFTVVRLGNGYRRAYNVCQPYSKKGLVSVGGEPAAHQLSHFLPVAFLIHLA